MRFVIRRYVLALIAGVFFVGCASARGLESGSAVSTLSSPVTRAVVVRLRNGTDVLEGLCEAIEREKIRNAIIVAGFGSITRYHVHVVTNSTLPPAEGFIEKDEPQDVINVSGAVIDGRLHPHITFANETVARGGHIEPGTRVFTFLSVTLMVLPNNHSLARIDDWNG